MWKAAQRPDHKISQSFNDGFVRLYTVRDTAQPGRQPVRETVLLVKLPYENRKLGVERYYSAKQNQTEIKRVLRVPFSGKGVTNRCLAVTEDGEVFRVDLVQSVPNVWPKSEDLTLAAYVQGGVNG